MTTTPASGAADRCQACFDRNDGFYGSYAPKCTAHNDDGTPRDTALAKAQQPALTAQAISAPTDHSGDVNKMVAQAISAEPAGATEMENLQRTAVGWQERALRAERNWVVCRRWAIAGGAPVEKLGDDPDQPFHAASPAIEGESNV